MSKKKAEALLICIHLLKADCSQCQEPPSHLMFQLRQSISDLLARLQLTSSTMDPSTKKENIIAVVVTTKT